MWDLVAGFGRDVVARGAGLRHDVVESGVPVAVVVLGLMWVGFALMSGAPLLPRFPRLGLAHGLVRWLVGGVWLVWSLLTGMVAWTWSLVLAVAARIAHRDIIVRRARQLGKGRHGGASAGGAKPGHGEAGHE